jgi:hypothetical protein
VALAGSTGHLLAADDTAGIVTKVRGQVTARKTGDEKAAILRAGDTIAVGQILQSAGGAAAQLVLNDNSVIHVLPGTHLQLGQYSFSAGENRRSAVIRVFSGNLRFIVPRRRSSGSRFAVVTDQVQIGVGVSDFLIAVSAKKTEVANIGPGFSIQNVSPLAVGRVSLGTNQRSTVADKEPPSQPTTITPEQRRIYLKDAEI